LIDGLVQKGHEHKLLPIGGLVVVVTGWRAGSGYTNTVRILSVPEPKKKVLVVSARASQVDLQIEVPESKPAFF